MADQHPTHPMQTAELALQELGFKHAPIQGYTNGTLDGRYVGHWNDPGGYYLLGGIDNRDGRIEDLGKIQLLFLQCPENAHQVAEQMGWQVERIEQLPSVAPVEVTVLSAILSRAP